MIEKNLAVLFRSYATEIESRRDAIEAVGPDTRELVAELDSMVEFLTEQARLLEKHIA